jgi:hypothetical protein
METWYKTSFDLRVTPVKVERSTDLSVWFHDWGGALRRAKMASTYENFFPSFREAKEFLIARETRRLEVAKKNMSSAADSLTAAQALEEPK